MYEKQSTQCLFRHLAFMVEYFYILKLQLFHNLNLTSLESLQWQTFASSLMPGYYETWIVLLYIDVKKYYRCRDLLCQHDL